MVANNFRGCFLNISILLETWEFSCSSFLISFTFKEKKATSEPDINAEQANKSTIKKSATYNPIGDAAKRGVKKRGIKANELSCSLSKLLD